MQQVSIFFTLLEGHKTLTRYGLSVAFKLTLVKFVNIGIIPLIVNQKFSTYFTEFGLTEDAFANITLQKCTEPETKKTCMHVFIQSLAKHAISLAVFGALGQ